MENNLAEITVCLSGDDRERTYPVTYFGTADFPSWEREDGSSCVGTIPVAIVATQEDREALVAQHPDYGWCSANNEFCRDFEPPINQDRLERAS